MRTEEEIRERLGRLKAARYKAVAKSDWEYVMEIDGGVEMLEWVLDE